MASVALENPTTTGLAGVQAELRFAKYVAKIHPALLVPSGAVVGVAALARIGAETSIAENVMTRRKEIFIRMKLQDVYILYYT